MAKAPTEATGQAVPAKKNPSSQRLRPSLLPQLSNQLFMSNWSRRL